MATTMHRAPRLPILIAIACALFLRAWVPAGWMPAANGSFAVVPCPAADPPPMAHMGAHHSGKHDPSHDRGHDGDCAFAPLSSAMASAGAPAVLLAPLAAAEAVPTLLRADDFKTGPPSLLPPATGPPSLT